MITKYMQPAEIMGRISINWGTELKIGVVQTQWRLDNELYLRMIFISNGLLER
jgi:hypothetical protein